MALDGVLALGVSLAITYALHVRHSAALAKLGVGELEAALRACATPFAAGLAVCAAASACVPVPRSSVVLLVYDEPGQPERGYIIRGNAIGTPYSPELMEVLPSTALQSPSYAALCSGNGEPVQRLSIPVKVSGEEGALPGGMLVLLLPRSALDPASAARRVGALVANVAGALAAALFVPPKGMARAGQQLQPLGESCVKAKWSWDVFAGADLPDGHCAHYLAEQGRQFHRAMGNAGAGCLEEAAQLQASELRLHRAALEMLCGGRTAALLAGEPGLLLTQPAAEDLLRRVRLHYRANPFHNFFHAVSVLHAAWMLAGLPSVAKRLKPLDTLALLLSALGHDLDHPGHTNALERHLGTQLAQTHNSASILERHHASTLVALIRGQGGFGGQQHLLQALPHQQRRALEEACIAAVLSTDLATHDELMKRIELPPQQHALSTPTLVAALLHAADLGAQAYSPVATQLNWVARIKAEFRGQAWLEEALGFPRSPNFVGLFDERQFAQSQEGFLSHFVLPLWSSLERLAPGELDDALLNIKTNIAHFTRLARD